MTAAKLLFLGTGASMGIPVIGCECAVCSSESSFNKRYRPSALLTIGDRRILLDAGPDLRMQALRYGINSCDGVILTHAHNDHIAGLDELRVFFMRRKEPIPLLLSVDTYRDVALRFGYMFDQDLRVAGLVPRFDIRVLEGDHGVLDFDDLPIRYFTYEQVGMKVNGFRIGNLAYVSDIAKYEDSIFEHLVGVKTLVLTALRFTPSLMHLTVDQAIAFAERVGATQTWLTHIAHELDYEKTNAYLPSHIRLAYDGLEIPFPD